MYHAGVRAVFRSQVVAFAVLIVGAVVAASIVGSIALFPTHSSTPNRGPSDLSLAAISIHYTIPVGTSPDGAAYDSTNFDVYVSNEKSNNVTVVSSVTHTASSITVGKNPADIAFDSTNGNLYVPNTNSSNVSIISNANKVIANPALSKGAEPAIAFVDPANGNVLVTNASSYPKDNVAWLIGSSTNKATAITLGLGFAESVSYNPSSQDLYVANTVSDTLSAISTSGTVTSIPLTGTPGFPTADPATGDLLVPLVPTSLKANASIEVLSSTNTVVTTIKVPGVSDIESPLSAYDPFNHDVYMVGFSYSKNASVAVIVSSSNAVAASLVLKKGISDLFPFYDPANGDVYLTAGTKNVTVLNLTKVVKTLKVAQPVDFMVYDPTLKDMVGAGDVNLTTKSTLYFISSSNGLKSIAVGKDGIAFLYDPKDTYVWVLNLGSADLQLVG